MFKVIQNMIIDLAKFMVLWSIVLTIFTSVSLLVFSKLDFFQNIFEVFYFYFESALGNWGTDNYCGPDSQPELCSFGTMYTFVFLLINTVLFLNFVIAILSSTFAYYEDKRLGLYYEVIVAMFPSLDYDERYGAVACA
mmetsp:Transcript_27175/g.41348  ORF Transcript_27175/g.41348 Transcript_27175/m.41348 type:complete len:138 (-) Transcript_27175:1023-1436(-)